MKSGAWMLAALGVGVFVWKGREREAVIRRGETPGAVTDVVVANRAIVAGTRLDSTMLVVSRWPVPATPAGALQRLEDVVGRVARIDIFKGEAIVPGRINVTASVGHRFALPPRPGKSAVSIRLEGGPGLANLLVAGDRLDLAIVPPPSRLASRRSAEAIDTLGLRVLSVDSLGSTPGDDGSLYVSVDASPAQDAWLREAATRGALQPLLRPSLEDTDMFFATFACDEATPAVPSGPASLYDLLLRKPMVARDSSRCSR